MIHLDLFSGIGGFALGLRMAGFEFERTYYSDIDKYANMVYAKNFPEAIALGDVTKIDGKQFAGQDVLITAGFPCQDISQAGKQAGITGKRSGLFNEIIRIASDCRPRIIFLENVAALLTINGGRDFGYVLSELARIGYDARWEVVSAADVGAPHLRKRVWIVAYPCEVGCGQWGDNRQERHILSNKNGNAAEDNAEWSGRFDRSGEACANVADTAGCGQFQRPADNGTNGQTFGRTEPDFLRYCRSGEAWWSTVAPLCGMVDELSQILDANRLINDSIFANVVLALNNQKELCYATTQIEGRVQGMCTLPQDVREKVLQRNIGKQEYISQTEILRSALHGKGIYKNESNTGRIENQGAKIQKEEMRAMRNKQKSPDTPHGQQSGEQYLREFKNAMFGLSFEMALATWQKSKTEGEEFLLQNLRTACTEIGYVFKTLAEIPEVWRSMPHEEKEWCVIRCCTGNFWHSEWPMTPRVATGIPERANQLKCLGNAVVPQVVAFVAENLVKPISKSEGEGKNEKIQGCLSFVSWFRRNSC